MDPEAQTGLPCSPEQDAQLVARLRSQDAAAYEMLVRQYGGMLFASARRIMRNEEDARDVIQEAFLQVFKAIETFEGSSRLSTWMHRIVVNAALMKLRSRARRPEESIEPLLPKFKNEGAQAAPTSWRRDTECEAERDEIRALVRSHVERLPETHRVVLMLRDIEGLGTEETARLLETTPNAVKIRLHRARQALRTLLDPAFREVLQ